MNWLDIVLIVVLAAATFLGLKTGIIKMALSLAGIVVGIFLAGRFHVPLANQLTFISQPGVAKIVAFAIILVGVMAIAAVLAFFLKWAASAMMLSWVNNLGGAVFGLALGALLCGALLAIWVKWLGAGSAVTESILAAVFLDKFPMVLGLLPSEFDAVRSFFQ